MKATSTAGASRTRHATNGSDQAPAAARLARGPAVMLLGLVALLAVTAYYPFDWDPPRTVRNEVTRTADGALRFGEQNAASTPGTPAWLDAARASERLEVDVQVRPVAEDHGPASIMMLAADYWHTDFAIGQDHADLMVWLRRAGSNTNGDPAFVVPGVLHPHRWTTIKLGVDGEGLHIDVDATTRLSAPLPKGSLRLWRAGRIALGDEVHGGGPWQGEIRRAAVRTPGQAVDYVRPGALVIPARYRYLPDHVMPFPPPTAGEWLSVLWHLSSFVPVGLLVVVALRPPVRPLPATLVAGGIAVVLAAGKFGFHNRHTAVADVVVEFAGGLLGALLARRFTSPEPARAGQGQRA
jgi:hypothetical protein